MMGYTCLQKYAHKLEDLFKALQSGTFSLELTDTSEQIGKVTTELHEAVMRVRMLPIKQLFIRFPRFVRDLAREKGKEINIKFEGEETELDKTVIDEIGEPLISKIDMNSIPWYNQ